MTKHAPKRLSFGYLVLSLCLHNVVLNEKKWCQHANTDTANCSIGGYIPKVVAHRQSYLGHFSEKQAT